jgi:hypothetical protein
MLDREVLKGAETDKKSENPANLSEKDLLKKNTFMVKTRN